MTTAVVSWQGLEAIYREIEGVRSVMLGEPTGNMELPAIYVAYQEFDRPLRSNPPARNLTGMVDTFLCRLIIQWVDNANAEMQLLTLIDAVPDALDSAPTLGGRVNHARCPAGLSGFMRVGGVDYRIVDFTVTVLRKREGT